MRRSVTIAGTSGHLRRNAQAREVVELILRAAASGLISTQEAAQMSAVIDTLSRTIDTEQMVEDLQDREQLLARWASISAINAAIAY